MKFRFLFCFNHTATTKIYTYGHTLSLHDALPISRVAGQLSGEGNSAAFREFAWRFVNIIARALVELGQRPDYMLIQRHVINKIGRDTSELQSLMRISYAVFCLKKKSRNNLIREHRRC